MLGQAQWQCWCGEVRPGQCLSCQASPSLHARCSEDVAMVQACGWAVLFCLRFLKVPFLRQIHSTALSALRPRAPKATGVGPPDQVSSWSLLSPALQRWLLLPPNPSGLVPPPEHLFLQTFWQTMNREWPGIDRLRLDKFYMVRMRPAPRKGPHSAGLGNSAPGAELGIQAPGLGAPAQQWRRQGP